MSFSDLDPDHRTRQINEGLEIASEFFESRRDTSIMLEPGKKILDEMAHFVEERVELQVGLFAIGSLTGREFCYHLQC